jgi:hypothetical protein
MQVQHNTTDCPAKTISGPILASSRPDSAFAARDQKLRRILDEAVPRSCRPDISKKMSDITGQTISVHMLNAWLAPGRALARFPVVFVEAFCAATGDDALKRFILGPELLEILELGERAAAILDERARRRVLKVPSNGEKRNGNGACAR